MTVLETSYVPRCYRVFGQDLIRVTDEVIVGFVNIIMIGSKKTYRLTFFIDD